MNITDYRADRKVSVECEQCPGIPDYLRRLEPGERKEEKMDIVNDLIRRRAACEQEIAEQDRKIQEYERAYESLRRFDGAVDTAQSNFHNVNTVS